jgi:hypothetical protein
MNTLIINKEKTVAVSFHQPQKVQVESPQIKMQDTYLLRGLSPQANYTNRATDARHSYQLYRTHKIPGTLAR